MNLKLILMAVGAFVLGLGGSTGVVVMRAPAKPDPKAAAQQQHAAATPAHPTEAGTTAAADTAPAGVTAVSTTTQASATTTPPNASTAAAAAPSPAHAAPAATPTPVASLASESPAGYRQVARLLAGMKPADAVKIVAYLSDDQVEGIFGQLGVRQASSLMSLLPTERAAALSRRMMKHASTEAK